MKQTNFFKKTLLLLALLAGVSTAWANDVNVTASAGLPTAVASASDGDVLLLAKGTYTHAFKVPASAAITIKAKTGDEGKVILNTNITADATATGSIAFQDVVIKPSANYFINLANCGNIDHFTFTNCEITNDASARRGIIGGGTNTNTITTVSFSNCRIHDIGNGNRFIEPTHIIMNVSCTNSTLYNYDGDSFFYADNNGGGTTSSVFTFTFNNNTVYKWGRQSNDAYRGILHIGAVYTSNENTYTIKDNIFWDMYTAGTSNYIFYANGSHGTCTMQNNLMYNYQEDYNIGVTKSNGSTTGSYGNISNYSSGMPFTDVAHYNFWINTNHPLATASTSSGLIGDPEWSKTITSAVSLATAVTPAGYGTAAAVASSYDANDANAIVSASPNFGYTFKEWQIGGTKVSEDNPYTFTITENTTATAVFTATNYIAAWDFSSTTSQDIQSNYYVDNDHKGTLNEYNSSNEKVNHGGVSSTTMNTYVGGVSYTFNAIRRKSTDADTHYYQAVLSTSGYTNVSVSSYLESWTCDTYKTQKLQYSTDGTTFYDLASVDLDFSKTRYWYALNGSNAAMDNQTTLYLRWIGSGERLTGYNSSNTEDLRLANIIITGTRAVSLNESSNYTPVACANANVVLTRSITDDKWSTIILPFDLTAEQVTATFGTYAKVAQFKGKDELSVTMSTTTTMNANEPYMIKVTGSEYTSPVNINGVTIETGDKYVRRNDFTFQGVYTSGTIPNGAYFVKNNQLYISNGNSTIKPFRAYFTSEAGSAHDLTLIIDEGGETTTIALLKADGTIETIAEGKVFDLQGRQVAQPTKGMYIVNGKKVIIK